MTELNEDVYEVDKEEFIKKLGILDTNSRFWYWKEIINYETTTIQKRNWLGVIQNETKQMV